MAFSASRALACLMASTSSLSFLNILTDKIWCNILQKMTIMASSPRHKIDFYPENMTVNLSYRTLASNSYKNEHDIIKKNTPLRHWKIVKPNVTSQNLLQTFHTNLPFCLYPRPAPGSAHPHQPPHLCIKSSINTETWTVLHKKGPGPRSPIVTWCKHVKMSRQHTLTHQYLGCPHPLQIHCSPNCLHLCPTESRVQPQSRLHKCNQ